jgi:transposase-like protein
LNLGISQNLELRRRERKNCSAEMKVKSAGDVWTWTALDAETKLIRCWFVGQCDASCAYHFIHDLKEHVDGPLHSPNEWILKEV